ncbi:hypothetical protein, partial [Pelomonas sp. KK5]|uniref:hypothetical protein n=1 Tax=Pelomonas sp. KK5 TaxID=1855730 RepID=UPI00097C6D5C
MRLAAYSLAAPAGELRVWVAIVDAGAAPPAPVLAVEGGAGQVSLLAPLTPIRDQDFFARPSAPRSHRCVFRITGLGDAAVYRLQLRAGGQALALKAQTLPRALPASLDGGFNILLCSCYSQPEDDAGLVGTTAAQIMMPTQLTLMMGDQIYGDLPIFEDLPGDDAGVADKLGRKYRRNFVDSALGTGGLGAVLARSPAICVADDHEYWNNFPYRQTQLPKTWTPAGQAQWKKIALGLYEDYQLDNRAGGTKRIDIDPLSLLVADMRSLRDGAFGVLLQPPALAELAAWRDALLARRQAGQPAFGMLVSGQAMMVEPASDSERFTADAELPNYAQYCDTILPVLESLAAQGVPVLYVTGDVHWSRVARALDVRSGKPMLFEVIVSPSCLIRVPGLDAAKEAANGIKGLFGTAKPWPRHGSAPALPRRLREQGSFVPDASAPAFALQGDRIAVLSLARAGAGIDFQVTYYGVSSDKALAKS